MRGQEKGKDLHVKTKKIKRLIIGLLLFLTALLAGYHMYCHHMVKKFYRYLDAGNWEAALVQVEKMPDVNMVDMCSPLYCLTDILLQGSASEGLPLERAVYRHAPVSIFEALLEKGADPNRKAPRGILTPFQYLCNHYDTGAKDVKIELMVQYGADIDSVTLQTHNKRTHKTLRHFSFYGTISKRNRWYTKKKGVAVL